MLFIFCMDNLLICVCVVFYSSVGDFVFNVIGKQFYFNMFIFVNLIVVFKDNMLCVRNDI